MSGDARNGLQAPARLAHDQLWLRAASLHAGEEWGHSREGLTFLFPTVGAGICVSGTMSRTLSEGDAVLFSSPAGIRVRAADGEGLAFSFFTVPIEHLYPLFGNQELHLLQQLEERLKLARMSVAPSAVAEECHRLLQEVPRLVGLEHRGQLLRVATAVLSHELSDCHRPAEGYVSLETHVSQVFENLSTEDLVSMPVGELASRFGCSRRHLSRLFHQYFGMSAGTLRMEMRLLKAASLLREPAAKVIVVAESCGFNHLGLFGTCFKRRFGMSPREWREHELQPAEVPAPVLVNDSDACHLAEEGLCPWHCKPGNGFRIMPAINQERPASNGRSRHSGGCASEGKGCKPMVREAMSHPA